MKFTIIGTGIAWVAWFMGLVNIFLQFYNEKLFGQSSIKEIWKFICSGSSIGTPLYYFSVIILMVAMVMHIVGAFMVFQKSTRIVYCLVKGLQVIDVLIILNKWIGLSTGAGILFFLILEVITILLYMNKNMGIDYLIFILLLFSVIGSSSFYAIAIMLLCIFIVICILGTFLRN